jgi:hypothetical protein
MNRRFRRRFNASLFDAQVERASARCYMQESGANETSTSVKKPERLADLKPARGRGVTCLVARERESGAGIGKMFGIKQRLGHARFSDG